MRTLHLMRHAEAQWHSPGPGGDHARPLSARGVQQARSVGAHLRSTGVDLIVASSATRTRQTAQALGLGVPVWTSDEIYNAGADQILGQVTGVPEGYNSVVVIGHAPGIPALVHLLADASSEPSARSVIAYRFPPATLASLTVHGSWAKLRGATLVAARIPVDPG
ncbi:SixA phosphatase family protein [Micropruina sp.]|uniref:SixA phosphatase family protein n=1 Tax=Micropruina sp. TaxID=2737536 RepID=UPI0039E2F9B6